MTITAQIIADSISPEGIRLTTLQLRYPRFIHAEFMTHRDFSRNASSSRAIPVKKMIEDLQRDPAMPVFWGANQRGMQAGNELTGTSLLDAKETWIEGMRLAIRQVETLEYVGLHKQIANRILEPWAHINVVVTATNWANFFALRRHPDAQPEIKVLADAIYDAMQASTPDLLSSGQWHLPYVTDDEFADALRHYGIDQAKKVSVARCARVSYLTHDGRPTSVEEDIELYDRLVGSQPLHASPAEHQATPDSYDAHDAMMASHGGWKPQLWNKPELHGNFHGWIQYRKTLPGEVVR